MQYIASQDRYQVMFTSLEERIADDNVIRFSEAFVEHLELDKLGYQVTGIKTEGRTPYESKLFLKIYLYGYLNAFRSSRKLQSEFKRNIEMQWLTGNLSPNYHSICDFRKVNPQALETPLNCLYYF